MARRAQFLEELFVYVILAFVVLAVGVGIALLVSMSKRDEPLLGVYGLISLNLAGMGGAAYGVLSSG
jgi:hypothetical protein